MRLAFNRNNGPPVSAEAVAARPLRSELGKWIEAVRQASEGKAVELPRTFTRLLSEVSSNAAG